MNYDDFLGRVQNRARLATTQDAVRATRATFETLGERLTSGEIGNLAAQLPRELGHYLEETGGLGERFDLREFFTRVSNREGSDFPVATFHAQVVLSVLSEAVSPDLIDKVKAQLPDEFDSLFTTRSFGAGQM